MIPRPVRYLCRTQRLIVEYTAYPHFASRLVWHPTLTYAASSVLVDSPSPDWRFSFLLCVNCYSALYDSYPFGESAIQSLLALALEFECNSASEAKNILKATLHWKKQSPKMAGVLVNIYKARLEMKMSEHEAEAAASLAKRLQELSISEPSVFDQFSTSVLYGMKARGEGAKGGGKWHWLYNTHPDSGHQCPSFTTASSRFTHCHCSFVIGCVNGDIERR